MLKIFLVLFLALHANASFSKTASFEAKLTQKGASKNWCPVCGMSIKHYWKTSHASTLDDNNKTRQYCSMRCLAVDAQEYKIKKSSIFVTEINDEELIHAELAFYVVGSKIKGTMSNVSKLAFASKKEAMDFVSKYGGKIQNFDDTFELAKKSLDNDIEMRNKKLHKKIYPMGKKIFNAKCKKDINVNDYIQINDLKAAIKKDKLCKNLNPKQLQVVSLYIWDVKRKEDMGAIVGSLKVGKSEKCPVCGMFVSKYPRWSAQIFYKEHNHESHKSFDGVKDMLKYYFEPEKWRSKTEENKKITRMLVSDYYSQKAIDAKKAYYVLYSDIYGPMGNELISFEKLEHAKTFKKDHSGKSILQFDEINKKDVYKLDE